MDLCQRPLAKPLSVLKDKANVKALSFLRSELLFSELVEVLLSGDQVNDAEGQFCYFRIRRVIRRCNVRTTIVCEKLTGLLFLSRRINSDRKSALCLNELHAGYIRITVSEVHHPSERYAPFILRDVLIYFLDVR